MCVLLCLKFRLKVVVFFVIFMINQSYTDGAATGNSRDQQHIRVSRDLATSIRERLGLQPLSHKKKMRLQCQEFDDGDDVNVIPDESARSAKIAPADHTEKPKLRRHYVYDYLRTLLERLQIMLKAVTEFREKLQNSAISTKSKK